MKTLIKLTVILAAFPLCLVDTARASVIFHFEDNERNVENVPLLPQGGSNAVTVKTSGHLVGQSGLEDTALSYITPLGLGVNNTTVMPDDRIPVPVTVFQAIDTFLVDSNHGGEFLRMEFSAPFQIELVWFRDAGPGERFSLEADGQPIDVVKLLGTDEIVAINPTGMVSFPDAMPYATTYDFYAHSSFSITNTHGGVIPEPTAAFVWCGLGLTLLAGRRSRRRA